MWRLAALALLVCAGCAAPDGGDLVADSLLGDVRSLLSGGEPTYVNSLSPSMSGTPVGTPSTTTTAPASGAAGVSGTSR